MQKEWYVVNTYSGHENKVKEKLEMRSNSMGLEEYIFRVVVPEVTEIEITKTGDKKEKIKKMFPGYILVEMIMTDEAWFAIRNTPGVTGFIGSSGKGAKPFPLTPMEVDKILSSMGLSRLELGTEIKEGNMIKVINGPFTGMYGKIKSINIGEGKLEALLDLFGNETPVELNLAEIEKTN
jgi:transcriptional antiterminator NusG